MGKSPKPLDWLIDERCVQSVEDRAHIDELRTQGHIITLITDLDPAYRRDIIMAPNAWRAFDLRYHDLAIKSARLTKYGNQKIKKDKTQPRRKSTRKGRLADGKVRSSPDTPGEEVWPSTEPSP